MAEGIMGHLGGDEFKAFSAGVEPTEVNPLAIKVMAEVGIDISKQRSKSLKEYLGQQFDYIITVCDNAQQNCPLFPGKYQALHWNLNDPAKVGGDSQVKILEFRKIRDKIKANIETFLERVGKS